MLTSRFCDYMMPLMLCTRAQRCIKRVGKISRCADRRFDAILHCAVLGGPSKELVQYIHILVHQLHDWELLNRHKSPHDNLPCTLCVKCVQVDPARALLLENTQACVGRAAFSERAAADVLTGPCSFQSHINNIIILRAHGIEHVLFDPA